MFWNIGQRGYQDLFSFIGKAQPKNLALTTKVLHKRKEIHIRIDGLTRLMKQGQNKLNELKSIAIKASSLSEMDYIKLQIKGEQERKQFGWEDRVAWLKEVIEQVQLIHDISEGKTNQKIIELEDRAKNFSKMQSASKQMNIERSN
ncbi:hypothetical protein TRFO_00826 [Tritrichomonas foetus]|uniref:Uncharacterized protein n=1 Tax=Tritrichomonas foetus TaxID=1144522 RepID=A0A1J4L2D5_9EUKA|nr:hypothetical protein TRFO_00826 [Tritrichomonas foetus]|eukprot:OHT17578.1 hypothetical protein TRFO_00826 [Tritrichomonas foetus]